MYLPCCEVNFKITISGDAFRFGPTIPKECLWCCLTSVSLTFASTCFRLRLSTVVSSPSFLRIASASVELSLISFLITLISHESTSISFFPLR